MLLKFSYCPIIDISFCGSETIYTRVCMLACETNIACSSA